MAIKKVIKKVGSKPASAKTKKGTKPKVVKAAVLPEKLVKYLASIGVPHNIIEHRTVYTAMDAAATMRKKMGEIAKSLLVKADKDYYLVILPADHNLDFKKLGALIGKQNKKAIKVIKIPGEEIMKELLKLKKETMSAFGGLHKLPVIVEQNLTKAKKAIFSTGSFNHSVEMAVKDFIKAEQAVIGGFGVKRKDKIQKVVKKVIKKVKPILKKKVVKKK